MIPFRDITAPLYNMHPSSGFESLSSSSDLSLTDARSTDQIIFSPHNSQRDCTHFCYFPQMWQSIWYSIYSDVLLVDDSSNDVILLPSASKNTSIRF
jgi:hypothetical protein